MPGPALPLLFGDAILLQHLQHGPRDVPLMLDVSAIYPEQAPDLRIAQAVRPRGREDLDGGALQIGEGALCAPVRAQSDVVFSAHQLFLLCPEYQMPFEASSRAVPV